MKQQLRTKPIAKALACILAVLTLAGGFWSTLFILYQWEDMWSGQGFYSSSSYYSALYTRTSQVEQLLDLTLRRGADDTLSYLDTQRERELVDDLSQEKTNFRYRVIHNDTKALILNNTGTLDIGAQVHEVRLTSLPVYLTDKAGELYSQEYALEYGVTDPLTVRDEFWSDLQSYNEYARFLPLIALLALVLDITAVSLLIFLCAGAGRRRGMEGVHLTPFDRIPLDLLTVLEVLFFMFILGAGDPITYHFNQEVQISLVVGLGVLTCALTTALMAFLLTVCVRVKAKTVLRNTLIYRICRAIGGGIGRAVSAAVRQLPLTWRAVLLFLLYLLGTLLTTITFILIPIYQGLVLFLVCRWTIQWRSIRTGTAEIVGGNPEFRIQTKRMYPDLREHAEALNDLGSAISNAVDEQLKSERFKAELITNVSHDLKTPLTSIINYVDLLKKEEIENIRANEYIEVLDRKSQRLKKLTEDLVEASKASTGNLTVVQERLDMVQLVQQAAGEFEEKFAQKHLELITTYPKTEVFVHADGRHLWRIVDNLLSNCHKYAMEGTRVYLEVIRWDGSVTLAVKNISRQPLNMPPEQLMERFVRGDDSRSTEGSGLGLSIARSLTELQSGTFRLSIDGDLFKAVVTFPEAPLA